MITVTLTEFRRNLFRLVDAALATGETIEIRRHGRRLVVRGEEDVPADARRTRAEQWAAFQRRPPILALGADLDAEGVRRERAAHWRWKGEPLARR